MWPFKRKEQKSVTTGEADAGRSSGAVVWSEWPTEKAINEGYKAAVAVYACCRRRAEAVSSVPFVAQRLAGGKWEDLPSTHPLQQLLSKPNPEISPTEFWQIVMNHLDLSGNAYMAKVRDGNGRVMELWPHYPHTVSAVKSAQGLAAAYKVGTLQKTVSPEDMTHLRFPNPADLLFGQPPLQAAARSVDVDNAALAYQKNGMDNRAIPDMMISFESDMTPDQYRQAKDRVREQTGPGRSREPLITSKANAQQLSLSPAEMDFIETRKMTREDICSAFGVPSELIAEMGTANRASADAIRHTFWLDTVTPILDLITESLTLSLASEYGPDIRITYDTSGVPALRENTDQKIQTAARLWDMGVPLNAINALLDLGLDAKIPGGDVGYINSGKVPITSDFNRPSEAAQKAILDAISNRT